MTSIRWLGRFAAVFAVAGPAVAGPPFRTDDPVPVNLHQSEIYLFASATRADGGATGTLPGVEFNYGAVKNLQLHVSMPLAFASSEGGPRNSGLGTIEIGAKYRLLDRAEGDWWPQIGVFPAIDLPTGNVAKQLGSGTTRTYLPVWLQWDFGAWTTYGGAGYWINPGAGNRDWWFAGWLVQRRLTPHFSLGGEVFLQTADTVDGVTSTGFNIGGIYDASARWHIIFSAGRGLRQAATTNQFSGYFGVQALF